MAAGHHKLQFPPTLTGMEEAAGELRRLLTTHDLGASARYNVELAFDEVAANIVRHAGATEDVQLHIQFERDEIVLRFEDNGARFDPSQHPDPTLPASLEDARIGGLGIMLVRQMSAGVLYERRAPDRNVLTLTIAAH